MILAFVAAVKNIKSAAANRRRGKHENLIKTNQRKKAKEKRLQADNKIFLCHWDEVEKEDPADYDEECHFNIIVIIANSINTKMPHYKYRCGVFVLMF